MASTNARTELQLEVERLFAYEAYLLDDRRFHEWLDLFTQDATYAVSVRDAAQSGEEGGLYRYPEARLFDESHDFTAIRVKRLETRLAHAEQPPSLTRHLITNVLLHENGADDSLSVSASFHVYQHRPGLAEQVYYGRRDDILRRVESEWRIAHRQVVLDTSLLPGALSIFF